MLSSYNCAGLVFASRRTSVDIGDVPWILEEDRYEPVSEADVLPGDVLLYKDSQGEPSHVAIVVEHVPQVQTATFHTLVVSQWGWDGEYVHVAEDVNVNLGKPEKFFRMTL